MNRPRRPPRSTVVHDGTRSFTEERLLGACESPSCDRRARAVCPECRGEYCLSHAQHGAEH